MTATDDSIPQLRKDHTQLASSLTALTQEIAPLKTEIGLIKTEQAIKKAVAEEQQKNLDDRLERIEESIKGLHGLGKWMLLAFGTSLIAAVVTFIVKGGLIVPPSP